MVQVFAWLYPRSASPWPWSTWKCAGQTGLLATDCLYSYSTILYCWCRSWPGSQNWDRETVGCHGAQRAGKSQGKGASWQRRNRPFASRGSGAFLWHQNVSLHPHCAQVQRQFLASIPCLWLWRSSWPARGIAKVYYQSEESLTAVCWLVWRL